MYISFGIISRCNFHIQRNKRTQQIFIDLRQTNITNQMSELLCVIQSVF